MKHLTLRLFIVVLAFGGAGLWAQKIETVDGVRVVHNEKGGQWGKAPKIALDLVRKIGDIDADDENLAFNMPGDVAMDAKGNIYVLDSSNARIQKFNAAGQYLATIGRKGQGPGDFVFPDSIDIDSAGRLIVFDPVESRIQSIAADGKDIKITNLQSSRVSSLRCWIDGTFLTRGSTFASSPKASNENKHRPLTLFKSFAADGTLVREFGESADLGETVTNGIGNEISYAVGRDGTIIAAFLRQNRIEKYSKAGVLLWRADRPLNYSTEVKKKGWSGSAYGGFVMRGPDMNQCVVAVAVDAKGRSFVVTYDRPLKAEEEVRVNTLGGAASWVKGKVEGNTDFRMTNALKLEIFAPDGILLGEIPLPHFVDHAQICGDYLFLIDANRGATVYQYKIKDL